MKFISAAEMYDPAEPNPGPLTHSFDVDRATGGSVAVNTAASRVGRPDYRLLFDRSNPREPVEHIAARLVDRSGEVLEEWRGEDGHVWVPRWDEWASGPPQPGSTLQVQVRYDGAEPVWEARIRYDAR